MKKENKENKNFNNSIELNLNGATLKLENYDPKQFDKIIWFGVYFITVVAITVLATFKL